MPAPGIFLHQHPFTPFDKLGICAASGKCPLDQWGHTITNEVTVGLGGMSGKSHLRQDNIHGVGDILQRIKKRSIQIKKCGFVHY